MNVQLKLSTLQKEKPWLFNNCNNAMTITDFGNTHMHTHKALNM
jgi:hypothetical protein